MRRSSKPPPSIANPTATQAPTFSPVYGSVAPAAWVLLDDGVVLEAGVVAVEAPALEEDDEPVPDVEFGVGVVAEAALDGVLDVVVVPSGSTYCWSPAEVPVPDASAVAVTSGPTAANATEQRRIWRRRRTSGYSSSAA